METIKEQHRGIGYVAWPHIDGGRLSVTAQFMRDGRPFFMIEDRVAVAGCAQGSMRDFAVAMVEMCINEEIALAESGQHPAWRFFIPDLPEGA
jgi:hypothetical protein